MKLNIEFQNYKLLKDTKATLNGSNVYLVQGANEQGKTSFINGLLTMLQAENKTKQPVTIGEKKGKISLDLQTKGGKDFKMLFEFTDQKNKFTLISDNQLMSKVTDIRSFMQYQSLTADEFISWSNTAEGRRKQRDIVLGLLGDDVKEKFVELTNKENMAYEKRRNINVEIKGLESIIANQSVISDQESENVTKLDGYLKESADLEIERKRILENNENITIKNYRWNNIIEATNDLKNLYPNANNQTLHDLSEIQTIAKRNIKQETDMTSLLEKSNFLTKEIAYIKNLEQQLNTQYVYAERLKEEQEKSEKLTDQIIEMRQAKTKLIADSDFPIQDVVIDDECLWIKTKDGLLPFDINQVSTSRIMIIVAKIILMLNKHLPIIVMGRGEAFDKEKLAELSKFADENECMLIIDKVTDSAGIEIVGYENV